MTITALPARDEYTASAGQTVFNYTFKIYASDELNVYITPSGQEANDSTDLTTAYTVDTATIGNESGGFITLDNPTSAGDLVTIVSGIPYDRTVDYQNSGDFLPDTVNGDNDRQVSQIKQVAEVAGRSLVFQQSLQNADSLLLPNPDATKFLRWRGDEQGLENVDLTSFGTPTDASVINYTPPFTGGSARTQEDKNTDFITITDFGAVDGGDSTAALLAAADSGLGVIVPHGAYSGSMDADKMLTLLSNIQLFGTLDITVNSGVASIPAKSVLNIVGGDNLTVTGTTESLSITSVSSVTGSAGAYSVVFNVASVGTAQIGEFLLVDAAAGTDEVRAHEGCWEITGVGASTITVTNTAQSASFPTNTLTSANAQLLKTVLQYDNTSGVIIPSGSIQEWAGIQIQLINTSYKDGSKCMILGLRESSNDSRTGGGSIHLGQYCGFSGAGNHGIVVGVGKVSSAAGNAACNNKQDGWHCTEVASMNVKFTTGNGNGEAGYQCEGASELLSDGSAAIGNASHGFETIAGGNMSCSQPTTIAAYNGADGYHAQDGSTIRANQCIARNNTNSGFKSETGSDMFADDSSSSDNGLHGYFCTRDSFMECQDSTSENNDRGYLSERGSWISALGTLTVSGNTLDYEADGGGDIAFTSSAYHPKGQAGAYTSLNVLKSVDNTGYQFSIGTSARMLIGFDNVGTGTFTDRWEMLNTGDFRPITDGGPDVGGASNRVNEYWGVVGSINTSDKREKHDIKPIDDRVLDAWDDVNFVGYRWNHQPEQLHFGVIAQNIIEVFESHGLNPFDYAIVKDAKGDGSLYMVNYDSCITLEMASLRRKV